jgi:formylglycine-generating enzyme required for sulfatase activity
MGLAILAARVTCGTIAIASAPSGRQAKPGDWNDPAYNHPAQPVVGISWYEARAYCAWLSAQTGRVYRLPTEAECQAAARGLEGRRYAWGNEFDAARCNSFETHVRGTTPIGVFLARGQPPLWRPGRPLRHHRLAVVLCVPHPLIHCSLLH